jgi:hypothetical protein
MPNGVATQGPIGEPVTERQRKRGIKAFERWRAEYGAPVTDKQRAEAERAFHAAARRILAKGKTKATEEE